MNNQKEVSFLPFHAINEFMLDEFRLKVIRGTMDQLQDLPEQVQTAINRLTKKHVKVPGFRNSEKAPRAVRLKPTIQAFEKIQAFTAAILDAWARINLNLGEQVNQLLISRGWELLPLDTDRTRLPGFLTVWPEGETYEVLHQAFYELFPESQADKDDISLMIVWLGARLPMW